MAALGGDIARQGPKVRHQLTAYVRRQLGQLADWIGGRKKAARRERAIAALSGLVGALVLARAVDDPALSDEILAAARANLGGNAA
jgi:TetR/AcrR family transcriptional repressor of nem operon